MLITCTLSCKNKFSIYYKQLISSYPANLVDHFPKNITKGKVDITENGEYDVTRLFLLIEDTNRDIEKFEDSIKTQSIASYSANDTCLFVVNKFTTEENYSKLEKAEALEINNYLGSECIKDKLPIANFWGLYDNSTGRSFSQLPDDYIIYVLEAKEGLYWDQKHRSDGKYMPGNWKHGYSKGIAISKLEHKVIFWFVLW